MNQREIDEAARKVCGCFMCTPDEPDYDMDCVKHTFRAGAAFVMERLKDEQCICDQCDVDRDFKQLQERCERLISLCEDLVTAPGWYGTAKSVIDTQPHIYHRMLALKTVLALEPSAERGNDDKSNAGTDSRK